MRHGNIAFYEFACVLTLGALTACSRNATPQECTVMLDKYVDMEMGRDQDVVAAEDRARAAVRETKKAQKKADASYKKSLSQCEAEVNKYQFDCAMRAETPEGWQACVD